MFGNVRDSLMGGGGGGAGKESGGLLGGASAPTAAGAQEMVFGVATAGSGLFDNNCCNMSRTLRLKCFVACFCVGFLVSCCSTLALYGGKLTQFAIFYTAGNLVALFSTAFLMGPMTQLKAMVNPKRIGATAMYVVALCATLGVAFGVPSTQSDGSPTPGKTVAVLALVFLQFLALVWYTASYIPFGRQILTKAAGSCWRSVADG